MEKDLTFSDFEKSKVGGTPLSPGYRQYVFHPSASLSSTPARSDPFPGRSPATIRTAERASPSHDDASAPNALQKGADASNTQRIAARVVVGAAVETYCRNINVTMSDRLADTDCNAH